MSDIIHQPEEGTRQSARMLSEPLNDASPLPRPYCEPDAHGRCLTCSDEALPARVVQVCDAWTAVVTINGETAEIDISLIEDVASNQMLLVHGGVALGSVSSE